jgi:hypothetical protein
MIPVIRTGAKPPPPPGALDEESVKRISEIEGLGDNKNQRLDEDGRCVICGHAPSHLGNCAC